MKSDEKGEKCTSAVGIFNITRTAPDLSIVRASFFTSALLRSENPTTSNDSKYQDLEKKEVLRSRNLDDQELFERDFSW
jgi:hypothetical protein